MDQLLSEAAKALFANGPLGIAVVGLVYYVYMLRSENRDERVAHKVELAEKDKLILQLYDRLVTTSSVGLQGLEAIREPLSRLASKMQDGRRGD